MKHSATNRRHCFFRCLTLGIFVIALVVAPTPSQATDITQLKEIVNHFIERAKCSMDFFKKKKPNAADEEASPELKSLWDEITPEMALTFHRMGGGQIISQGSKNFVHFKGNLTDVLTLFAPSMRSTFDKNYFNWWSMWPIFAIAKHLRWIPIVEDGVDALSVELSYYGLAKISFQNKIPLNLEGIFSGGPPTTSATSIQLQIADRSEREALKQKIEKVVFELQELDPQYGIGVLNTIGGLKLVFFGYYSSFDNAAAFSKIFGLTDRYFDLFGDENEMEEM